MWKIFCGFMVALMIALVTIQIALGIAWIDIREYGWAAWSFAFSVFDIVGLYIWLLNYDDAT